MPIKPCTANGKSGHKYGDSGHCYTGENSREMAGKQAAAVHASQAAAKRAQAARSKGKR